MQHRSGHSIVPGAQLIKTIMVDNEPLQIVCRRDWREALRDLGLLTRSLPQNSATKQEVKANVDSDRILDRV